MGICHWSPSVVKANEDQRQPIFFFLSFRLSSRSAFSKQPELGHTLISSVSIMFDFSRFVQKYTLGIPRTSYAKSSCGSAWYITTSSSLSRKLQEQICLSSCKMLQLAIFCYIVQDYCNTQQVGANSNPQSIFLERDRSAPGRCIGVPSWYFEYVPCTLWCVRPPLNRCGRHSLGLFSLPLLIWCMRHDGLSTKVNSTKHREYNPLNFLQCTR